MPKATVTALKPNRAATLLAQCRKHAGIRLPEALKFTLGQADDALFELANKADNSSRQNLYFDAMRELRLKRDEFAAVFEQQLEQTFDDCINSARTPGGSTDALVSGELSLVEIDDVEQTLAVTNFAENLQTRARGQLFPLNQRLGILIGDTNLDDNNNPLGPQAIGDALRTACQVLESDVEIKLTLLKLFDRCSGQLVSDFYRELNEELIKADVMPEITQQAAATPRRARTRVIIESEQDSTEATGEDVFSTLEQLMRRPGSGIPGGSALGPLVSSGQVSVRGPAGGGAGGSGGAAVGGGVGGVGEGAAGLSGAGGGVPAAGGAVLAGAPLMQGLTTLQRGGDSGSPVWQALDPGAVSAGNVNVLQTLRDSGSFENAEPSEHLTLEIVSLLFDYVLEDPAIPDGLKALIGRLQIPVLKVALLDREVFSQKQHPARRLLDELAAASIGWSEGLRQQDELYSKVEAIVNRIVNEFENDVALFATVLEDFLAFVADEEAASAARAEASTRSLHTKERVIQAKMEVDEAIRDRIAEIEGRDFIRNFILDYWRQLLIVTLIEEGRDGEKWQIYFHTFEELVWSAAPKDTVDERKALIKRLPPLVQGLKTGMAELDLPPADRSRFLSMLASVHVASVRSDEEVSLAEQRLAEAQVRINARRAAAEAKISARRSGSDKNVDFALDGGDDEAAPTDAAPVAVLEPGSDEFIRKGLERIFEQKESGPVELDIDFTVFGDEEEAAAEPSPDAGDDTVDGTLAPVAAGVDAGLVAFSEEVATLDLGDWLELIAADGSTSRVRFTWISPDTGRYLFTTRAGEKALDRTMLELAAMLRDNEAIIVRADPDPLFERALGSLIEKLEAPGVEA